MRHILTCNNGRILLDQLKPVYLVEFGIRTDINIDSLMDKKLLRLAPQVLNLSGHKSMVWAPGGRPYPKRVHKLTVAAEETYSGETLDHEEKSEVSSHVEASSDANKVTTGMEVSSSETASVSQNISDSPQDRESNAIPHLIQGDREVNGGDSDIPLDDFEHTLSVHPLYKEFGPPQASVDQQRQPLSVTQASESKPISSTTPLMSRGHNEEVNVLTTSSPTLTSDTPSGAIISEGIDPSPYGFLEKEIDPSMITEVIEDEDHDDSSKATLEIMSGVPFTDEAIEILLKFARPITDDFDKDFEGMDDDIPEDKQDEVHVPNEPVDYLTSGMNPDEVLEEMQKLKERSGGILTPKQMDPFLTYFGELSSRELDRLEELEKKEKPKKETQKKKRVMAARFPGQSPAPPPNPYTEYHLQQMEFLKDKLPVAPDLDNLSDSDSDGSCPRPIAREESIRMLLERGLPDIPISQDDYLFSASSSKSEQDHSSANTQVRENIPSGEVAECDIPKPLLDPSEASQDSKLLFPDPPMFDTDESVPALNDHQMFDWPDFNQPPNN